MYGVQCLMLTVQDEKSLIYGVQCLMLTVQDEKSLMYGVHCLMLTVQDEKCTGQDEKVQCLMLTVQDEKCTGQDEKVPDEFVQVGNNYYIIRKKSIQKIIFQKSLRLFEMLYFQDIRNNLQSSDGEIYLKGNINV